MKRVMYVGGTVILSGLSAFGAAQVAFGLGLGPEAATLACIAGFIGNFFMIEPIEDIIIRK
jgi:hypothetical protein